MKLLHVVYQDGVVVGQQMAKTADRACYLFARKNSLDYRALTAVRFGMATLDDGHDWQPIPVDDTAIYQRIRRNGGTSLLRSR